MTELFREKIVNIIANATLESRLIEISNKHGATGYTILPARGGGGSGVQTGTLDSDSNILFMLIIPDRPLKDMLDELQKLIKRGHHLVVYVSNTEVMRREKFE